MRLSPDQSAAADAIASWLRTPAKKSFKLGGYAGTGKTTTIQELINKGALGPDVACCAPTGKAAQVLSRRLGGIKATTIHQLIYQPRIRGSERLAALKAQYDRTRDQALLPKIAAEEKRVGELTFVSKDWVNISPGTVLVVDEASMVTPQMAVDLSRTSAKIIYVGDPGQLPPVKASQFFANPDFTLTQVHRQALQSPIIRASLAIREDGPMPENCPEFMRVKKGATGHEEYNSADVILCGMNLTRMKFNRFMRKLNNRATMLPCEGDVIIVTKNNYAFGLMNGQLATAIGTADVCPHTGDHSLLIRADDGDVVTIPIDPAQFLAHYTEGKHLDECDNSIVCATYGYAITVHKAQGSEWPSVILADDAGGKFPRKPWLYTAVTRAKEHLRWIVK